MRKIQIKYIIDAVLIFLIMILLEYIYVVFVNKHFSGSGFSFEFNFRKYLFTKIILFIALFINSFQRGILYFVSSLLIILLFIPNIIIYEFVPKTPLSISIFSFVTILFLYLSSYVKIVSKKIILPKLNKVQLLGILAIILFIPLFITYKFDLNLNIILFEDIYEVRANSVGKMGTLSSYFYPWLVKIVFPLLLILSLYFKKRIIFIIVLLAQLYLFVAQGHKSVFMSIPIILFYYIKSYEKQTRYLLYGIIFTIVFTQLLTFVFGNIFIESMLVRRVFFVPAINNVYYFEYFKDINLYYSNSVLKNYINYPFDKLPQYMIGEAYYNAPKMSANNGFISDGIMNLGILGVLINIIGIVTYFRVLSSLNISYIFSGILIIIIFTLISSYFLTSLLTHGLLLFLLLSFLFLQDTQRSFK